MIDSAYGKNMGIMILKDIRQILEKNDNILDISIDPLLIRMNIFTTKEYNFEMFFVEYIHDLRLYLTLIDENICFQASTTCSIPYSTKFIEEIVEQTIKYIEGM